MLVYSCLKTTIMKVINTRRLFLKSALLATGGMIIPTLNYSKPLTDHTMQEKPSPISPELVLEFVKNSHGNFEKVKELLDKQPNLLNAAWDWGNGDYETGMNEAGHNG